MAAAAGGTVAIEPAEGAPGPPLMLPAETYQQISDIVQKSGDRCASVGDAAPTASVVYAVSPPLASRAGRDHARCCCRRWAVRKILRMGVLTNQRVEYRKFGTSVLTGAPLHQPQ